MGRRGYLCGRRYRCAMATSEDARSSCVLECRARCRPFSGLVGRHRRGAFTRRLDARVRRERERIRILEALRASTRAAARHTTGGHRWCRWSLLFTRRGVDWLFRRRLPEKDPGRWRRLGDAHWRQSAARGMVGRRRRHRARTGHSHGPHEDLVVGRRGRAPDRARRLRARDHPSLAADLAGKQGHRVHRCSHGWGLQQRQYRRDVARDRRTSHRSSRRVPRTVSSERAHRLPSRSDALCGTIRSGGARDHGPAHPGHRRRRLRQQRRRPIRPVGQRHAGVFRGGGLRQSYNSVDAA